MSDFEIYKPYYLQVAKIMFSDVQISGSEFTLLEPIIDRALLKCRDQGLDPLLFGLRNDAHFRWAKEAIVTAGFYVSPRVSFFNKLQRGVWSSADDFAGYMKHRSSLTKQAAVEYAKSQYKPMVDVDSFP